MLTQYIQTAMRQAKFEALTDGTFYGEIPALPGVYCNTDKLETCRAELQEVLEGWLILGLRLGHPLPVLAGIDLNAREEAACCGSTARLNMVLTPVGKG